MKNIVLFGFMGCGKSTVGEALARMAGRTLLDTDVFLEKEYGRAIPQIFAEDGEQAFRRMEREICRKLAGREDLILCCGGGTVLDGENAGILSRSGHMVFLDVPYETAWERIKDSDRPLVVRHGKEGLRALYETRRPVYLSCADIRIDATLAPRKVAEAILEVVEKEKQT